jgi:hypothetical protein
MLYFLFLPLILSLAIYFVPVLLLRHKIYRRAQDYFVASNKTSPTVFQNASIAYQLQMATFGPFFLWGSRGDFWPVIVNSLFFGIGLLLVFYLRKPLFLFLNNSLRSDASVTVHEFMARQHGDDSRVRVASSVLTVFALFGLVLGECLGLATLLKPILLENVDATYIFVFIILLLIFLYTVVGGNSGVMRSDQAHLGVAYAGLFGGTLLLLILFL